MNKIAVTDARRALVLSCLERNITDHREIGQIAKEVAKNCRKYQVAGIKAHQNGAN